MSLNYKYDVGLGVVSWICGERRNRGNEMR